MSPEQQKIQDLERRIERLESFITERGRAIVLTKTVQVDGKINADKVYTQRSGSYAELTT